MIDNLLLAITLTYGTPYFDYVSTPKGTSIKAYKNEEFSYADILANNDYYDRLFPFVIRLSDSSKIYNCHSYAWYSQDYRLNKYNLLDVHSYYQDGSYIEIDKNDVRSRDRICYFDKNNKIIHSGIILSKVLNNLENYSGDESLFYVQSKWGVYALYQHKGDQCPYVKKFGGDTSYVKFYRYNLTHSHNFEYEIINERYHFEKCECGYLILEHKFIHNNSNDDNLPSYVPVYVCEKCGYSSHLPNFKE